MQRRALQLRLPEDIANFIDTALEWRGRVMSRNEWIEAAAQEKFERDVGIRARELAAAREINVKEVVLELVESGASWGNHLPTNFNRSWLLVVSTTSGRQKVRDLVPSESIDGQISALLDELSAIADAS